MEDLELLKNYWNKNSDEFKNYSEKELFQMIRKNTFSISKLLLIIGLIEVSLWLILFYLDSYDEGLKLDFNLISRIILFICFIGSITFCFFKIKVESNSKKLISQILQLRKIILSYVIIMFSSVVLFNILKFKNNSQDFIRGYIAGYNEDTHHGKKISVEDFNPWFGYTGFAIILIIVLFILIIVYKKVYGKLLLKLESNLKELKKIQD